MEFKTDTRGQINKVTGNRLRQQLIDEETRKHDRGLFPAES
jgi:hypothetical protein